jgi:hypothetical protein
LVVQELAAPGRTARRTHRLGGIVHQQARL